MMHKIRVVFSFINGISDIWSELLNFNIKMAWNHVWSEGLIYLLHDHRSFQKTTSKPISIFFLVEKKYIKYALFKYL